MRTREAYSLEQRKVWKEQQVSDNLQAIQDAVYMPEYIGLAVEPISRTVYNRTKVSRGVELLVDKPRIYVLVDTAGIYQAYFDVGDACYRTVHGIFPYLPDNFKHKLSKPRINMTISMEVKV